MALFVIRIKEKTGNLRDINLMSRPKDIVEVLKDGQHPGNNIVNNVNYAFARKDGPPSIYQHTRNRMYSKILKYQDGTFKRIAKFPFKCGKDISSLSKDWKAPTELQDSDILEKTE